MEAEIKSFNFGYVLALVSSLFFTWSAIMTKKLTIRKVHFSIVSVYAAVCGLPVSLVLVIVSVVTDYEKRDFSRIYEISFVYEVAYLVFAGVFGK